MSCVDYICVKCNVRRKTAGLCLVILLYRLIGLAWEFLNYGRDGIVELLFSQFWVCGFDVPADVGGEM